ncbi:hypothetical protein FIC_01812 [Flavobacteriaceae bacterium 3519-10]|nr:hypothetical protein FIC_01812 [Flavobacteriaceae bacterium 3519-10]
MTFGGIGSAEKFAVGCSLKKMYFAWLKPPYESKKEI